MSDVRWSAFIPALVLAPLAPALPALGILVLIDRVGGPGVLYFFMLLPVGAVVLGALPWLVFGGPAFWWHIRTAEPGAGGFWAVALAANVVSAPVVALVYWAFDNPNPMALTFSFILLGCVFAPIWGAIFGRLYDGLDRVIQRRMDPAHESS